MCLGVVGKIIQINKDNATVDIMGVEKTVMIDLIPDIAIGDYVLIHAGMAIERLKRTSAEEIISIYKEIDFIED